MGNNNCNFSFGDFKLLAVHFDVNRDFAPGTDVEMTTQLSLNHEISIEQKMLRIFMKIEVSGKTAPFSLIVEGAGLFEFTTDLPSEDQIEKIARINCAAIAFPYLRETVADITRRSGFPPLHIPPVNFVDFFEKNHKKTN